MLRFILVIAVALPSVGCFVHERREPYIERRDYHHEERREDRRDDHHEHHERHDDDDRR